MSARLRKREHDRRVLRQSNLIQLRRNPAKQSRVYFWRAIQRDMMRVFGNNREMAWEWFINPAMALDNKSPMHLLVEGNLQQIRDYLIRLEYGVYM